MSAKHGQAAADERIDDDPRNAAPDALLIDQQDQLHALLENVPALVFTLALDARIVFVNRAPFDIPMAQMIGRNLFDFPGREEHRQVAREAFARAVALGTGVDYEVPMEWPAGVSHWFACRLGPVLRDGRVVALVLICTDTTERKRAETELQRAHHELEDRVVQRTAELAAANQSLHAEIAERMRAQDQLRQHQASLAHVLRVSTMGEMAAGLAHEINQPLGAIANFANGIKTRLRAGTIEPDALLNAAQQIAAEALRAGEVIRRLRDFVRRDDAKREPADLNGLVREAAHLVEPDARRASIGLRLALDPTLLRPQIDPIQIEQVLLNLMRNGLEAMAATEHDAHELLIETSQRTDDSIEVRVRDTGSGVAPAVSERVFDAFFTTKARGLGMGLSISRSLIEDHGGTLWMRPNLDRGTTFGFSLPLSYAPLSAERRVR